MFEITNCVKNKDDKGLSLLEAHEKYIEIYGSFVSKLQPPEFYPSKERDDIFILDFSKSKAGLKAFGAEKLIAEHPNDLFGYASPRVGHASEAIAYLCEEYNKKCVFFAPASKEVSLHQAVVTAYKGSSLRFAKIPAMPTMNAWIRQWADNFGATALPFGLANIEEVTAGLINMCVEHTFEHGEPTEFYCAVSTGTMIRALQIGWPNANANGIAVARNIKSGEIGNAYVESYHKAFYKKSDFMPNFNTTATYDAKAYMFFVKNAKPGSIFINVGSDQQIENRIKQVHNWKDIDSQREWGNQEAFSHA